MGGVRTGLDALELVAAGARHVAIGTTLFADPDAPARIRMELLAAAAERGWSTYEDAYAAAHEHSLSLRTT
jgi:dihydroorotate dehydrogenase (NAD+) catalytic subunit